MRNREEKKHYFIKILFVLVVIFLAVVGFMDFNPHVQQIEKSVPIETNS